MILFFYNITFKVKVVFRDASLPTKVGIPTFLRFLQKFPIFSYYLNVSPEPSKMAPSNPKMPKISRGLQRPQPPAVS